MRSSSLHTVRLKTSVRIPLRTHSAVFIGIVVHTITYANFQVFLEVTQCVLVNSYQNLKGEKCLYFQDLAVHKSTLLEQTDSEDGGTMLLSNTGNCTHRLVFINTAVGT
jgi:hypothetical protein